MMVRSKIFVEPRFYLNFGSGGSSSSTRTETGTTSGQNSPVASEGSQSLGSGSIGVAGAGAKYLEQGAADLSGAQLGGVQGSQVQASEGSTINIGDPQAVQTIAALAQNFSDQVATLAGSGGAGSTVVTTPGTPTTSLGLSSSAINWILGIAAVLGLAWLFLRKKKT